MGSADQISAIFWLCFAVVVIIQSSSLGLGTLHQPGPGFLFFYVNIVLGIMSLVLLFRSWREKRAGEVQPALFKGQDTRKIMVVLISLFLYAILMERLGFILVTLLLFIFLLGIIEKKGWVFTVFVSVVVTAITYLIFETWLQCMLPGGLLEFLRF